MTYVSSVEDPELDEVELDVLKQLGNRDGQPLANNPFSVGKRNSYGVLRFIAGIQEPFPVGPQWPRVNSSNCLRGARRVCSRPGEDAPSPVEWSRETRFCGAENDRSLGTDRGLEIAAV